MAVQTLGTLFTLPVTTAVTQYQLLNASGGAAALTDQPIGVAQLDAPSNVSSTNPFNMPMATMHNATLKVQAAAAITAGVVLYNAAGGLVSSTSGSGSVKVGIAKEAAAAQYDVIEMFCL